MTWKLFDEPVYLTEREGLVREIMNLEDAIEFLEGIPTHKRDLVHDVTLKTCYMAHDGHKPLFVARDALQAFGRKRGILVDTPPAMPWRTRRSSGGGRSLT